MIYHWDDPAPPFAELVRPLGARTVARLRRGAPPVRLARGAWDDLAEECACWSAQLLLTRLYLRLCALRALGPRPEGTYQAFVASVARDDTALRGQVDGDAGHVLERALSDWSAGVTEMLLRLAADGPGLAAALGQRALDAPVVGIEGGLSEYHRGAAVRRLRLESGASVLYKPRACGMDGWWTRLADWLQDELAIAEIKAPRVWARSGHGWCEDIPHHAVSRLDQVRTFHHRTGQLLCWLWLTQTRDAVRSNLIAAGAWPVLVDAETALYPLATSGSGPPEIDVTATGLLPVPRGDGPDRHRFVSGLSPDPGALRSVRRCLDARGDRLRLARSDVPAPGAASVPRLLDAPQGARGFVEEIVAGFVIAYERAARHAAVLLAEASPLSQAAGLIGRLVLRPTAFYGELLHQAALAAAGLPAGAVPELLERGAFAAPVPLHARRALMDAELAELRRASMPRFAYRAGEAPEIIPLGLRLDGWCAGDRAARARIRGLDDRTLEAQVARIRDAFQIASGGAAPEPSSGG